MRVPPLLWALGAALLVAPRRAAPAGASVQWDTASRALAGAIVAVELGVNGGTLDEVRGILDVVEARAARRGARLWDVMLSQTTGSPFGSGCKADPGCRYNALALDRVRQGRLDPRIGAALEIAPVAPGAENFLHPRNAIFASPRGEVVTNRAGYFEDTSNRILDPTVNRWLPRWAVSTRFGGTASYVRDIGTHPTRFSR